MYYLVDMASSSSPYAIFTVEDWMAPPSPIGISKCIRVKKQKSYKKSVPKKKPPGSSLKMQPLKDHVQLAFA